MPTDLSPRFEAILKKLDTRRVMTDHRPTLRERALMATFWEQITPTFEEYGKLRKRLEEAELALARHKTEHAHGFRPDTESTR